MASQPPPEQDDPRSGRRPPASSGLQSFEFSFNVPLHSGTIEPDPDMDDLEDSSASLSESVQNYPEEFGRTYHAYRAGSYAFPNDAIEQERLAIQNSALTKLFGNKLYFAPLPTANPPKTILDVATGTGDWAIDMGDLFPEAQITATDLSPIQPEDVPPNVNFFVEDSSEPWDYSEKFDYIHTRSTAGCWSSFEEQVARQAFEALNPGGYFESQELDSSIACDDETIPEGSPMLAWFHDLANAGQMLNRPTILGRHLKGIYERVGFVDVEERIFKMPTNAWPKDPALKELGRIWERNLLQGLSGFSFSMFNRAYGRTPAQIEVSLVDVRREFSDPRIHAYMPIWVVWGRKPREDEN